MSDPSTKPSSAVGSTGRATDRCMPETAISPGQDGSGIESGHESLAPYVSRVPGGQASRQGSVRMTQSARRGAGQRGAGRRGLNATLRRLSARDIALLDLLAEHRFLTTHHLQTFCFHDHATPDSASRTARRVLARLATERLIERPARRVGGLAAGSDAHVWTLTSVGHRLRSLRSGTGSASRVRTPSARFIDHYLAVADVRLELVSAERRRELSLSRMQIEPICWQPYTGLGGSRELLKPDLAVTTSPKHERDFEDHWYVEVDRATESIPTLLRQCRAYEGCRASGVVQDQRDVFPLVVWVVPTERRARNLRNAIDRARGLDTDLYRICTPDQLLPLILGGAA